MRFAMHSLGMGVMTLLTAQSTTIARPAVERLASNVLSSLPTLQGDAASTGPSISADGRFVAFASGASNLVPGDTNDNSDIFVHDRQTGQTTRVSVDSNGAQSNGYSYRPSVSTDGRFVAFESGASNLVSGDTNSSTDIFVHDRQTDQTTRVSIDSLGVQSNGQSNNSVISADGRFVVFQSLASNLVPGNTKANLDIFMHDRQTGQTTIISAGLNGAQSNEYSEQPSVSADGRFVAFHSWASNLVPDDTNDHADIFVHDRQTDQTTRVSVDSNGAQGNNFSISTASSADGRFVAFASGASNLVPGDDNNNIDIFVHDRQTGQTTRVSVDSNGAQSNGSSYTPSVSTDGRFVAFASGASNLVPGDDNNNIDVFVHDRQTGQTTRVSVGSNGAQSNDESYGPSISADGLLVAYQSDASNLVAGDTNAVADVFVHDRGTIQTTCVSLTNRFVPQLARGALRIALSDDARWAAFVSTSAHDLGYPLVSVAEPQVFLQDRDADVVYLASALGEAGIPNGSSEMPAIASDGRFVAFHSTATNIDGSDNIGALDVFVRDRLANRTHLVSVAMSSSPLNASANAASAFPAISADARFVTFESDATNLVSGDTNNARDIFLRDRQTQTTTRVSLSSVGFQANGDSFDAAVSADGRYVVFTSVASNLIANDTNNAADVFIRDRVLNLTRRVSVSSSGVEANDHSWNPAVSSDGRYVVFQSLASNLVSADTNNLSDVFLHDRNTGQTIRVSVSSSGAQGNGDSGSPTLSANGRVIAFQSGASNLAATDLNDAVDIFVHDLANNSTTLASRTPGGAPANNYSYAPALSPDGRYVGFDSDASDIDPTDTNNARDAFVFDRGPDVPASCPGDANGDFRVDFLDLNIVLGFFGQSGPSIPADLNRDGVVDFLDLNIVLSFFGQAC